MEAAPAGRFGTLVPDLNPCPTGPRELDALVRLLTDCQGVTQNSVIPAGFTYLGQFIDHDITFDPTPFAAARRDPAALRNFRTPRLDLDSVYGLGPELQPYLYDRDAPGKLLLTQTPLLDLPRNRQGLALLGDRRNDEHAIVSQLHLLFLRFHNRIAGELGFEAAQRLVRRHFHWIVLREYLPAVLGGAFSGPREHFVFDGEPFIPVEFSGAAFRFGHSMARDDYGVKPLPTTGALSLFPELRGFRPLEPEREIAWQRFFAMGEDEPQESSAIDTRIAPSLFRLPDGEPVLARRTLRRGVKLGLPSGQDLAAAMGAPALEEPDLLLSDVPGPARAALSAATPLWYWLLCEAEKAGGLHLGPLGRQIVGEVLTGLIETDPESFLVEEPAWVPGELGGTKGVFSMASLVRFAQGGEPE
jgi:hypothetical protein